jgi:hypothetical protein
MGNDYSSGREACQAKIARTRSLSCSLLGMSELYAKLRDINFQTKSVWFDPEFFSWSVRATLGECLWHAKILSGSHLAEMLALICWASLCSENQKTILRALNTFQPDLCASLTAHASILSER